ncbi:uncharacterized protein EI90DRAFT_1636496 [Cantharellus anzutake]|uniref:uncharacterized protein n=1 Tax=Cantharellus anzutake TaxID=1750568 RepID=UPI0019085653|nr:uncharacterized protein EI90DRAFT_1636496 [Cantharellus anzutake]KAF8327866.1 hypothetical protein EI90DRAFT_1636496 [Cantharellus anzutake]
MTDSNSHHGTWCLGSSGITERIKQPRIVQDGEIFTFGKIVEKNGQLYHPAKVSIKLVYDDVYPDEEAGIANGYDDVSQGAPHTNRYGLLDDEMSDVDSIYNDSAEHTPSQFVSHFADGFLDVIGNDGPEEPSGAPPCNPCSPGSPSPILSSSCYSTGDVDRQVVLSKPVSSIRNLLHYDYDLSHEPSPAPSPSQHEEDMIMSGSEASDSESSESEDSLLDDFYPQQLEGPFVSGKVGDMKESLKVEVASTTPHTEKRIADLEKKLAEVAADLECTFRDNRMVIHEMEDERSELLHELEHLRADAVDMKLEDISGILLGALRPPFSIDLMISCSFCYRYSSYCG